LVSWIIEKRRLGVFFRFCHFMRLLTASLLLFSFAWINTAMALDPNEQADAVYSVTWHPTFCKMRV